MGHRVPQRSGEKASGEVRTNNPSKSRFGTVLVLHSDASLYERLRRVFQAARLETRSYSTAFEIIGSGLPEGPICLVTGASGDEHCGLVAYERLKNHGLLLPAVFLAHTADFRLAVKAMRAGADDFVALPFDESELVAAVFKALDRSRRMPRNDSNHHELRQRAATLTEREREIVAHVIAGMLNKEIAAHLGLALVTIKVHRGNAMRKLGARTSAELARIARSAGI